MNYETQDDLRQKIMNVAWDLFYQKGYVKTTVGDIIEAAGTSKGGFYYYFKAKDELLNSLYSFFDQEYERFYRTMDKSLNCVTQLHVLCQCVFYFIEGHVKPELLAELYRSQLANKTQENFLSPNRYYLKIVKSIISEGQARGEIRDDLTVDALAHHILLLERGILTDWCVQDGGFPLGYEGIKHFELYTEFLKG